MAWKVFTDFDNTISIGDVTDCVLETFAAPEWLAIEEQWKRGEIGSRACMEQQIALVSASKAEMDALADSIEIDAGFVSFATFCQQRGVSLTILSDGLDYFIRRILGRHGLQHLPVVAGQLTQVADHGWQLKAPHALPLCASGAVTCKCAAAQNNTGDSLLYIGDGRSDFCVSGKKADLVLAKTSLLAHCIANNITHLPCQNFDEALTILQTLMEDMNNTTNSYNLPEALYAKRA